MRQTPRLWGQIENGRMRVPTGPDLGFMIDADKLDHHARRHTTEGDLLA